MTTVSDAKRMIDEVASPYLQPMVDTTAMGVAGETLEDWFAAFGDGAIHEMHFIDGDPYGHLVWGDGKHDMDASSPHSTPMVSTACWARKSRTAVTTMTQRRQMPRTWPHSRNI